MAFQLYISVHHSEVWHLSGMHHFQTAGRSELLHTWPIFHSSADGMVAGHTKPPRLGPSGMSTTCATEETRLKELHRVCGTTGI